MDSENGERDKEFEEFARRKKGSGQAESPRNPKGSGRGSNAWKRYQKWLEFQELEEAGIQPRGLGVVISEEFNRLAGRDEGRRAGDSKRDRKGLIERTLQRFKIDVSQFDLIKEDLGQVLDNKLVQLSLPYILPWILAAGGVGLWYWAEESLYRTYQFTNEEWAKIPQSWKDTVTVKLNKVVMPITPEMYEDRGLPIPDNYDPTTTEEVDIVLVKKKRLPQVLHGGVDFIRFTLNWLGELANFLGFDGMGSTKINDYLETLGRNFVFSVLGINTALIDGSIDPNEDNEFVFSEAELRRFLQGRIAGTVHDMSEKGLKGIFELLQSSPDPEPTFDEPPSIDPPDIPPPPPPPEEPYELIPPVETPYVPPTITEDDPEQVTAEPEPGPEQEEVIEPIQDEEEKPVLPDTDREFV